MSKENEIDYSIQKNIFFLTILMLHLQMTALENPAEMQVTC